jgi:hypothetical protein
MCFRCTIPLQVLAAHALKPALDLAPRLRALPFEPGRARRQASTSPHEDEQGRPLKGPARAADGAKARAEDDGISYKAVQESAGVVRVLTVGRGGRYCSAWTAVP